MTPCSRQLSQLVSGWVSVKWSWWQRSRSSKMEPGTLGWAFTASAQAWSRAMGSKEANMPTSGTMGRSFSLWQSQ